MRNALLVVLFTVLVPGICFAQNKPKYQTPNSYREYKLGITLKEFLSKNKNVEDGGILWVLYSGFESEGMVFYTEKTTASSGDKIEILYGFYKNKLAIISVAFKEYQSGRDILDMLKSKYGPPNDATENTINDFIAGKSRLVQNIFWDKPCCILNLNFWPDIGGTKITFADSNAQKEIKKKINEKNKQKLE